jgi:hypothetical protein
MSYLKLGKKIIGTTRANAEAIFGRIRGLINTMGEERVIKEKQNEELRNLYNETHGEYDTYENLSKFIESNNLSDSIKKIFNLNLTQMGRGSELLTEISIPRATVFLHELLTREHPDPTPDNYDEVEARKRFNETEEETNERLRSEILPNEDNGWIGGRRRKRSRNSKKFRKSKKSKRSRKSKRSKRSRRR